MQWQLTFNSLILGIAAGIALIIRWRTAPGSPVIVLFCIAIAIWAGADAHESAAVPQAHTRREDTAYRLGGDEFVVMLSGTSLAETFRPDPACRFRIVG
jgi:hypothetical protein